MNLPRKEVIQPQVLLQLPCYDFTPITLHTFSARLPYGLAKAISGTNDFRGVTGGVYKVRERIHRSIADLRLLETPASCRRFQPTIRTEDSFKGLAPDRSLATLCTTHCSVCVAQGIKAMLT